MAELNPLEVAQELLKRKRAQQSLSHFREYMAATNHLDFMFPPAKHHQVMIHHLDRLEKGEISKLMILAPPGSAKSTYCSIQQAVKHLCYHPHENIIAASNTQDLATGFNRRRLNACISPQWMQLSGTKLDEKMQSVEHFGTERGGSIKAVGVTTSVVGNRSHFNILDDPIRGVEEACSPSTLDKQWDWFQSEFRTRLVPDGKELIVSTRWAKKDIAGRVLSRVEAGEEDWTVLRLPMLADRVDDPLGRSLNEPLWPEYFKPELIHMMLRNEHLWKTQYQQTPLDETGEWLNSANLVFEDIPDSREVELKIVIAMDLALSVGKGDYTVIIVAGIDCWRRLHILHMDRARTNSAETVDRLVNLCRQYNPSEVLIDDDNQSKVFINYALEAFRNRTQIGSIPPIHPVPMLGQNKETRAAAIRSLFITDNVRIVNAQWNRELVHECLNFPASEHDDIVDTLGLFGRRFRFLPSPKIPPHLSGDDPAKNCMIKEIGGIPHLNIPLEDLFLDREDQMFRRGSRI